VSDRIELVPDLDKSVEKIPEVVTECMVGAERIAAIAVSTAAIGETGDYVAGIDTEKTKSGARVIARARESAFVEFGVPSQGQAAHFTLRRAAESAGYKFRKGKN
jgi:hypothetical protein